MTTRCTACGHPLSPAARFGDWCETCAIRALHALEQLRQGDVGMVAAWFRDQGVPVLASIVIGPLPFGPPYEDLLQ